MIGRKLNRRVFLASKSQSIVGLHVAYASGERIGLLGTCTFCEFLSQLLLRLTHLDFVQNLSFRRELFCNIVFRPTEDQRTDPPRESGAFCLAPVFFNRRLVDCSERFERTEQTGHQKVHQAPEFPEMILHRGPGKTEPVFCPQLRHRLSHLRTGIFDILRLVEREDVEVVSS